jgi:hypothetical protein
MKRIAIAAALILAALGLVACGGSSSSTSAKQQHLHELAERYPEEKEAAEQAAAESGIEPASERHGDSSASPSESSPPSQPAAGPPEQIEERCTFAAEELRANPSEADAWKATLEGCMEEVKDADEPARVAREEKEAKLSLRESRAEYRQEKEAHYEAAIARAKAKVAKTERAEIHALKALCSTSVSEVVAAEQQTGDSFPEYWRECR